MMGDVDRDCYNCGGPAPVKHDDLCVACYGEKKIRQILGCYDFKVGNVAFVRTLADLVTDLEYLLDDVTAERAA